MHIEKYEILPSTKELAEQYIISNKYNETFVILAKTQTLGVGRKDNFWHSPRGGLWFSLVLKHISTQKSFTLFVGYCVLKALNEITKNKFEIKWPNDIYLLNNKICGLICSQYERFGMTHIGVGINTNNEETSNYASIKKKLNKSLDNSIYLSAIISNILELLPVFEEKGLLLFENYYKEHDYLKNKKLTIESGNTIYTGLYKGIGKDGSLLIEQNSKIEHVYSGTVTAISNRHT